ncbi:MAG: hypothetical protein C0595_02825 [Marinilabiliales bacterium]|nr:MAG: hypothetical protein C0595_02825 [Marinilabiliales bacterium]
MIKVKKYISKSKLNRGFLLAFLMLFISSGSYTYSDSIKPEIIPDNSPSLFVKVYSSNFIGFKPFDIKPIKKSIPIEVKTAKPSVEIAKHGVLSIDIMASYLHDNNPEISLQKSKEIATLYFEEAKLEGINHDVAFSQMCLETGFLKFGGDVASTQNNFCGLGVTGKGVKGLSFEDERKGIRAHIQHLKAYATTQNLKTEIVDTRFKFVKRGSAKRVDDLTGKWAADKNYGKKIQNILKRLQSFDYASVN